MYEFFVKGTLPQEPPQKKSEGNILILSDILSTTVLVKARGGGVDYIYSLLQGYEDPPSGVTLDDGVYYNKYMYGNKIRMAAPLSDGIVEYGDGTNASVEQMSKDVTTFLMWAAEPHLEARHQMGFKAIVYLIILTILVYFSMKKILSRVESEV